MNQCISFLSIYFAGKKKPPEGGFFDEKVTVLDMLF